MRVEVDDLQDGYLEIVKIVLDEGREVSPRGQRTREVGPVLISVKDPTRVVPVGVGRKPRLAIGAAEAMQLIAGLSDAVQFVKITKNFAQFVEGGRLRGGYGPRAHAQFPRVVDLIKRDPDTRQAGVVIWRPWDLARPSKDVPCTVELHFALRDGRLEMMTTMRSNDVFWGLPYDAWMFATLQHALAYALDVPAGAYHHSVVSLHAYVDRDASGLAALHSYDATEESPPVFSPIKSSARDDSLEGALSRWDHVTSWARIAVGLGRDRDAERSSLPQSVAWYRDALLPFWSGGLLCPACRYVLPKTEEHFYFAEGHAYTNRLVCRSCRTLRKRGLAPDDYERLLMEQGAACAICRREAPLVIDHDHASGVARGLLCKSCNATVGIMEKRSAIFDAARSYIEAHSGG